MASEPKTAKERVKIVDRSPARNPYCVRLDGLPVKRFSRPNRARLFRKQIVDSLESMREATVRECCAVECGYCEDKVPYNDETGYHESDGTQLVCQAFDIRCKMGVTP